MRHAMRRDEACLSCQWSFAQVVDFERDCPVRYFIEFIQQKFSEVLIFSVLWYACVLHFIHEIAFFASNFFFLKKKQDKHKSTLNIRQFYETQIWIYLYVLKSSQQQRASNPLVIQLSAHRLATECVWNIEESFLTTDR